MRILHVFRTPVGGLFRHVRDLARGQAALGHEVGMLCDSGTGGEAATKLLEASGEHCSLGIARLPIGRMPGPGDISAARQTTTHARALGVNVIHCHGAKGGLLGRVAARRLGIHAVYTPHGGSLHFRWMSPHGAAFLAAEWLMARLGCGLHFVCEFERQIFDAKIGIGRNPAAVIYNGLWPEEFDLAKPLPDASDLLFIGELRDLKGVDLLIEAVAALRQQRPITLMLVGDGPDEARYRQEVARRGLDGAIVFAGRLPAREAFRRGRLLVMPSRHESFPYVVLEAMAAGVPLLASAVGGIPEVLPAASLFEPGRSEAIAASVGLALDEPARLVTLAMANRERLRGRFTAETMAAEALAFYGRIAAG